MLINNFISISCFIKSKFQFKFFTYYLERLLCIGERSQLHNNWCN